MKRNKKPIYIIPFIQYPSLNIQFCLLSYLAQESPHKIRQLNLEIIITYNYDIRMHVQALLRLALPLERGRRSWGYILRPMLPSDAARLHKFYTLYNINKQRITINKLTINNKSTIRHNEYRPKNRQNVKPSTCVKHLLFRQQAIILDTVSHQ